jgi:hypothetical protein
MSTQHLGLWLRRSRASSEGRLLRCETGLINTYLLTESKYKKIRESAARRGASVSVRSRTLSLHLIPSFALTRPETTATRPTSLSHSCRRPARNRASDRVGRRRGDVVHFILISTPVYRTSLCTLWQCACWVLGCTKPSTSYRSGFFWEANNPKHKYHWVR